MPRVSFDPGIAALVLGLLAAAFAVSLAYASVRARQRRRAAHELGFTPVSETDPVFAQRVLATYQNDNPSRSHYKLVGVCKQSKGDYDLYNYDLYTTTSRLYDGLALVSARLRLPKFAVVTSRGGGFSASGNPALASGIGKVVLTQALSSVHQQLIEFPQRPDFAAGYTLAAPDEEAVSRVLTAPVLDWFVRVRSEPGMNSLQITGEGDMLTWAWLDTQPGDLRSPHDRLQRTIGRMAALYRLFADQA